MLRVGGHDVAALYQADGRPPAWLSYVSVEDAGATAARARDLGGTVLQDAFDDPQDAAFGLFEGLVDP